MITLKKFKKLDYEVQLHCLYGSGVNLELYRTVKDLEVVLYSLGTFYVEIYFNNEITRVLHIKAFQSVKKLNPASITMALAKFEAAITITGPITFGKICLAIIRADE